MIVFCNSDKEGNITRAQSGDVLAPAERWDHFFYFYDNEMTAEEKEMLKEVRLHYKVKNGELAKLEPPAAEEEPPSAD